MADDTAGGAEQVLARIDAALIDAGHRSLVLARPDSRVAGELIPVPSAWGHVHPDMEKAVWQRWRTELQLRIRRHAVDLVHFHGCDFLHYLPTPSVALLATLHLPIDTYGPRLFDAPVSMHCVSNAQARDCPTSPRLLPTIPNGVADLYRPAVRPRPYCALLGRICPEKGLHLAIGAARAADYPALLAGEVFPYAAHRDYYRQEIRPRLGPAVRYIGPAGPRRKSRLLSAAQCLLIASRRETSSLVAMEALMCGTPRRGVRFPCPARDH